MRRSLAGCVVMVLAMAAPGRADDARSLSLMPVPSSVETREGRLALGASFTAAGNLHQDQRLDAALRRFLVRLGRRTSLDIVPIPGLDPGAATLRVDCDGPGLAVPGLDEDESYTLEVDDRQVHLRAPTVVGALRGLETVLQLTSADRGGWYLPAIRIEDRPRFRWRGLLIDVARHWMTADVIKRNLDAMALVKLNVLHLHLTEDQGFRIESKKYPRLHQLGSDGHFFTQDEMRELIAYARDRGIRVVPEFDIPGHSTSWLVGHPELGSAPGPYQIERKWGIMEPALDPTNEAVYKVLDGFLGEMAALFPDAYMHIGGDENEGKQWMANERIRRFMAAHDLADAHALQAYFNQRLSRILTKHGKRMIGWDEVLHPDLPKNTVIQSWRGQEALAEAARRGYSGILSNGYYIDLVYPASQHYAVDPMPEGLKLTDDEAARILGGEACMWAEYVDPVTIDSRIWPRLGAIAERLWSPRSVNDVDDMYRRLDTLEPWLEGVGSLYRSGPAVLIRNLAGGSDPAPVRALTEMVEPVKGYRRGSLREHTQFTPLTRVVDAAQADSPAGRAAARAVEQLLADAPRFTAGRDELIAMFAGWMALSPALERTAAGSPALVEVLPVARHARALGVLGQDALAALASGDAGALDEAQARATLAAAGGADGQVELAVLPAVRLLVAAALERPSLDQGTVDAWRTSVRAKAETLAGKKPEQ